MSQPLLSIGMIVKNEERSLEKCLKALDPLRQAIPCELVIADTGSTDKTKEIASKYANILFDFTWVNDFSIARNAVISKCSGKWFLSLDADEYLMSDVTEIINLVTEKYKNANHAFITIRDYASTTLQGFYSDFSALRVTRLTNKTRFVNPIHERLDIKDLDTAVSLTNTIFAHDGYADADSEFVKKKMLRNLELLEKEYESKPNDTTVILQLLESCHIDNQLKLKYSRMAMEHINKLDKSCAEFTYLAPAIARKAIQYAVKENYIEAESWFCFAETHFKTSFFYSIDIVYLKIQWYIDRFDYKKAITTSEDYFKNLKAFETSRNKTKETMFSSIKFAHPINQSSALISIANAYIKLENEDNAYNTLEKIELLSVTPQILHQWLSTVKLLNSAKAQKLIQNSLSTIFNAKNSTVPEEIELYNYLTEYIKNDFAHNTNSSDTCEIYSSLDNCIGICAKIVTSDSEETIQQISNSVSDWNELLPLALGKIINSKIDLPTEFYSTPLEKQHELLKDIYINTDTLLEIIDYYTNNNTIETFEKLSFAFNLLTAVIISKIELDFSSMKILSSRFYEVSKILLTNLYREELLNDFSAVCILPAIHRFSLYYIMAVDCDDPKEKISLLRKALKEEPKMKNLINHILEEFKNEEELKRQEKIKTASPELLQMAEQLKTMLKAFPENSAELLAIKQSPVYKQVAFLIEE